MGRGDRQQSELSRYWKGRPRSGKQIIAFRKYAVSKLLFRNLNDSQDKNQGDKICIQDKRPKNVPQSERLNNFPEKTMLNSLVITAGY